MWSNGWDGLEVAFVLVEGLFCRLLQMGQSRATADNRPQVAGTDTAVCFAYRKQSNTATLSKGKTSKRTAFSTYFERNKFADMEK